MKDVSPKSVSIIPAPAILAFTILLITAPVVNAQTDDRGNRPRPSPATAPKTPDSMRPPSIRQRQMMMDEMVREATKNRTRERERLAMGQIAEDYQRIQIINNKMMSAAMYTAKPNYGSIADTTAEIGKRASRMRDNLRLPKGESAESTKKPQYKSAADFAMMKAALLSLDNAIMSFIKSPIFRNTDVVNVEQATKARGDLETVIEFSRLISKDAEKLQKSSANPD